MITICYFLLGWNGLVCTLYGIDKYKALNNQWRISEKLLIESAFLMGGLGALLGMMLFRHKTKRLKFKILVPLALLLNSATVASWYYYLGK